MTGHLDIGYRQQTDNNRQTTTGRIGPAWAGQLQLYHSLMIILAKIIVMTMLMIKDEDSHIIHIYINV